MNSMTRRSFCIVAIIACCRLGVVESADRADDRLRRMSDVVCGPRCAQFVLDRFGIQTDLVRLVEETQWPRFEEGTTLRLLEEALARRGIESAPLRIDPSARLDWPHPVIAHMRPPTVDEPGHYIVLLPEKIDGKVKVWDGLAGTRVMTSDEFHDRCSGTVLLTSPTPIDDPLAAVRRPVGRRARLWLIAGGIAASILLARSRVFRRRTGDGSADGRRAGLVDPGRREVVT